MATFDYEFSITDDFVINQKVNITILQEEIEADSIIVTTLHHIDADLDNDTCTVVFNGELTPTEEDQLNILIAAHTGELPGGVDPDTGDVGGDGGVSDIIFVYGDHYEDYYIYFKHTSYKIGTQFIFRGTNTLGKPKGVKAILKGTGKLRLYDKTNNQVLFEWEDIDQNENWDIFSYADIEWPANEAILELQGRETHSSDKNLYCSSFMICFLGSVVNNFPSGSPL